MFDLSGVPTRDAPWITDEQYGVIRRSVQSTPEDSVKLYHPELAGLRFGPAGLLEAGADGLIIFGQVEPHFAVVRGDHPLLDPASPRSIWRLENRVVLVEQGSATTAAKRDVAEVAAAAAAEVSHRARRTVTTGRGARKRSTRPATESPSASEG